VLSSPQTVTLQSGYKVSQVLVINVTGAKTNDLGQEGAFLTTFPYLHPAHTP